MNNVLEMKRLHFTEPLPMSGGQLDVLVEVGSLEIFSHDAAEVSITADVQHMTVEVWREGDRVFIRAEREEDLPAGLRAKAELAVAVPTGCLVRARTITGKLAIRDVSERVVSHVTTGKTVLSNLGSAVDATTVTGAIRYEGLLANEQHRFRTTTGNIQLALHEIPDAWFEARTTTGRIQCQLPLRQQKRRRSLVGDRLSGYLGAGAGQIKARVVTGKVRLEKIV